MGSGSGKLVRDDVAALEGPDKLEWEVPQFPGAAAGVSPPVASRDFAAGDVVHCAYCLELGENDFDGSYLAPYLPVVATAGGQARLFPFGWGLLYGRGPAANLNVEHRFEAPPAAGGAFTAEPAHWLVFSASVAIAAGEALVAPGAPLPHVFAAAASDMGEDGFGSGWRDDPKIEMELLGEEAPECIGLIEDEDSPLIVAASPMAGVGVFAARDIQAGEVLEVAPTLPLHVLDVEDTALQNYAFESSFTSRATTNLMHLGLGCVYNHSSRPNASHRKFSDEHPYIEAWFADRFIAEGEEICHHYGGKHDADATADRYFNDRGITQLRPEKNRKSGCC